MNMFLTAVEKAVLLLDPNATVGTEALQTKTKTPFL